MEEITFSSQKDLYRRIHPALRSKVKLLSMQGFSSVKESDIWDYLRLNKWVNATNLELCELVDDILHCDNKDILIYCHNKYMNDVTSLEGDFNLPKLKQ